MSLHRVLTRITVCPRTPADQINLPGIACGEVHGFRILKKITEQHEGSLPETMSLRGSAAKVLCRHQRPKQNDYDRNARSTPLQWHAISELHASHSKVRNSDIEIDRPSDIESNCPPARSLNHPPYITYLLYPRTSSSFINDYITASATLIGVFLQPSPPT